MTESLDRDQQEERMSEQSEPRIAHLFADVVVRGAKRVRRDDATRQQCADAAEVSDDQARLTEVGR